MLPSWIEVRARHVPATHRQGPRLLFPALVCASMSLHGARVEAGEARLDWVYDAPPGCPASAEVELALREHVSAAALERDPRRFVIEIVRDGGQFVGKLTFLDDAGERVVRERTCKSAVQALVLFIAIALDPASSLAPSDAPPVVPPAAPSGSPADPSEPAPPAARRLPPEQTRGRSWRRRPTVGAAVGAGVTTGPVPGPAPVFAIAAAFHQPLTTTYGLAARLGFHASYGSEDLEPGRIDAYLIAGSTDLTPTVAWRWLMFAAGPRFTLGGLSATARDVAVARETTAIWTDLGLVARVTLGSGRVRFEAHASGAASLIPRTYLLRRPGGERVVHTTPSVLLTIGAALVVEL